MLLYSFTVNTYLFGLIGFSKFELIELVLVAAFAIPAVLVEFISYLFVPPVTAVCLVNSYLAASSR